MNHETEVDAPDLFSTDTSGLPEASSLRVIRLHDGDRLDIDIGSVRKSIEGADLRMLGYNGSIPGPTLHVDQGSEITVQVTNGGDIETTVHWHGLRLENRYDGVPHETQEPIPIGGTFTYKVQFPDPGFYWYHPHIREDYGQEMGLYGTIVVEPSDRSYWAPVDRELTLTLDDLLVEDGHIAPFRRSGTNFTAMGRFGNVMLINGETAFAGKATQGEILRLYLVNTANTRIFNFALPGARMKLVGADSGRYEHETFVDEVMLSPSERAVIDVRFDSPGDVRLEHRTPDRVYELGVITVARVSTSDFAEAFEVLRVDPVLSAKRQSIQDDVERDPDKVLAFFSRMPLLYGTPDAAPTTYACPMHPEVTGTEPSSCPKCGMKLVPVQQEATPTTYACPMHPEVTDTEPSTCPKCGMKLVPVQQDATNATYACPMHPEITDTEPSTCPKCGMKLVPVLQDATPTTYACPMHPEVTDTEPSTCPKCGMKLVPVEGATPTTYACPMHPEVTDTEPSTCPKCGMKLVPVEVPPAPSAGTHPNTEHGTHEHGDGLEWEDLMPEINRASDPTNMIWDLVDRQTGARNGAISWAFTVGDQVKIRLVNEMASDHPMHHPFHVHGAGRFLILSRDGEPEPNLAWKDTVLVRSGQTVDILLDVSNPGLWMAHCHIAEHIQSGMMFSFNVARRDPAPDRRLPPTRRIPR